MKCPASCTRVPDISEVPNRRLTREDYARLARIIRHAWYACGHAVEVSVVDGNPPRIKSSTVNGLPRVGA